MGRQKTGEQPSTIMKKAAKKIAKKAVKKAKPAKRNQRLNARQERFCELVASGKSQVDAYMLAGFKATKEAARRAAARLLTNVDIEKRIAELRKVEPALLDARMTKDEKLRFLAELIRTPIGLITPESKLCAEYVVEELTGLGKDTVGIRKRVKMFDKLRAIELHSKLMGHFEPDRLELELGNTTLQTIKERAKEVGFTLSRRYATQPTVPLPHRS